LQRGRLDHEAEGRAPPVHSDPREGFNGAASITRRKADSGERRALATLASTGPPRSRGGRLLTRAKPGGVALLQRGRLDHEAGGLKTLDNQVVSVQLQRGRLDHEAEGGGLQKARNAEDGASTGPPRS